MNLGNLFGSLGPQNDPFQEVLGTYYDPNIARRKWIGGTLQGVGAGLASGRKNGWAEGLVLGGTQGVDNYKKEAAAGYRLAQDKAEQDLRQQQLEQEMQDKQKRTDFIKTLPPDQQMKALSIPGYLEKLVSATDPALQKAEASGGAPNIGLTPIPLLNKKTGEYGVGQLSDNGLIINGQPVNGSDWQPYDPYNLNAQKAAGSTVGKGQGTAQVDFNSLNSKMPGLENVVSQLDDLAEKATYTLGGQMVNAGRTQLGMDPSEGAVARTKYQSLVANQILPLLRDTFGAQFTAREGDTLMATLGDPNKTPPEKQAVLKAFIEQKRRDVEALAAQAGQTPASSGASTSAPEDPLRLR